MLSEKNHPRYFEIIDKINIQRSKGIEDTSMAIETNPFVFAVTDRLVDELSNEKYNMIIESSLKSPDTALNNAKILPPKGYNVELAVMCTPDEVSWQSTIDRYMEMLLRDPEMARKVDRAFYEAAVNNIAKNLDIVYKSGVMSNILLYNREQECLYDMSKTPDVNPTPIFEQILHSTVNEHNVSKDKSDQNKSPSLFSRNAQKQFSEKAAELNKRDDKTVSKDEHSL